MEYSTVQAAEQEDLKSFDTFIKQTKSLLDIGIGL